MLYMLCALMLSPNNRIFAVYIWSQGVELSLNALQFQMRDRVKDAPGKSRVVACQICVYGNVADFCC